YLSSKCSQIRTNNMPQTEALRVARGSTGTQNSVSVGNASAQYIAANTNRIALVVFAPPTNPITISSGTAVVGNGFVMAVGAAPVVFKVEDYGTWLTGQLNAINAVGAETCFFIEVTSTAGG